MNAREVSKTQFKARALEIFRQVEVSGESVVVTDKGRPAIEVRRFKHDERSPLDRLRGSVIEINDPFEPVAADEWEALR